MTKFDPFAVLGVERRYDIDAAEVERKYLEKSAALHPDMLGEQAWSELGGDPGEAAGFSDLNRARHVLEDPEQRAVALWKLLGGVEEKSLPPTFLMEMMDIREQIDAARSAGDAVGIAKWEGWAEEQRARFQERVAGLFGKVSAAAPAAALLRQIKLELNSWRYIERLVEQFNV